MNRYGKGNLKKKNVVSGVSNKGKVWLNCQGVYTKNSVDEALEILWGCEKHRRRNQVGLFIHTEKIATNKYNLNKSKQKQKLEKSVN